MTTTTTRRRVGIAGALVGAASAGVAAAALAKRYAVGRIRLRHDAEASEPFGELRGRERTLVTSDGKALHVEIDGPEERRRPAGERGSDAAGDPDQGDEEPLTVVFCHGYCLSLESWHYQRKDLRENYRMVLWDQRSHGRSQRVSAEESTIDRLGDDLAEVIERFVPGPCVLVGHSMGGMTIMALADRHPELFGDRIRAVALIATSAGKLAELTLGLPAMVSKVVHKVAPATVSMLGKGGALVDRTRNAGSDIAFLITRYMGFGDSKNVSPTVVDFAESMIRATPTEVVADFYPALMNHDKLSALHVLDDVPTAIMVGERDWLTPPEHSRAISSALPKAQLTEVPDTSHLIQLERPGVVNDALRDLIKRVEQE
ncbi:alpha/beta fold hydrolase [Nonomuraea jiangxiensis]|uniref:Pimeloyl-ACP methyl ester carboxylesterase n=1 Tax=Nonomuraea jiangxiensis TaxID=633440 RepID=A0A1G8G5V1_9ACTN|nr:alpha/beta hydrolase [Nonomuraea jiangxiensis]SDH89670.1 Pimeloyl-ACP methyl ester carboxylesterase [Nonomuraea jiangxiensis]